MKKNCWEITGCGREEGGSRVAELGICPASCSDILDGVNSGQMGGRCCWAITGTLCRGEVQGIYASKLGNCLKCQVYQQVEEEEGAEYTNARQIIRRICLA